MFEGFDRFEVQTSNPEARIVVRTHAALHGFKA
jgi:hypothetical protein